MKENLEAALPEHTLISTKDPKLYIVDYKDLNRGKVELLSDEPEGIKYVFLKNENQVAIYFDGFPENALPIAIGHQNKQCECVLFPMSCRDSDWILFVETKYANDLQQAFNDVNNYPNGMINQIIKTVKYFRDKGIIAPNRRVNAIVSFPNLIETFDSTLFNNSEFSVLDILLEHKIRIRATNSAQIISEKRIKMNAI